MELAIDSLICCLTETTLAASPLAHPTGLKNIAMETVKNTAISYSRGEHAVSVLGSIREPTCLYFLCRKTRSCCLLPAAQLLAMRG